jgi:hypothetical protein
MRRFTPRRIRGADDVTPELPTSSCIRQPSRASLCLKGSLTGHVVAGNANSPDREFRCN